MTTVHPGLAPVSRPPRWSRTCSGSEVNGKTHGIEGSSPAGAGVARAGRRGAAFGRDDDDGLRAAGRVRARVSFELRKIIDRFYDRAQRAAR